MDELDQALDILETLDIELLLNASLSCSDSNPSGVCWGKGECMSTGSECSCSDPFAFHDCSLDESEVDDYYDTKNAALAQISDLLSSMDPIDPIFKSNLLDVLEQSSDDKLNN